MSTLAVPRAAQLHEPNGVFDRFLSLIARDPNAAPAGATARYTVDNCLDFAIKTIPDLQSRIAGKRVLDFGCGHGWQSIALAKLGAAEVLGLDIVTSRFPEARERAQKHGVGDRVRYSDSAAGFEADIVLSISAFEHFSDPAAMLRLMRSLLRPGGEVLLAWAEPWLSPNGSHVNAFTRLPGTDMPFPWLNLICPEHAVLRFRSRYRRDGARRYEDIEGGLNKMTLARFERILNGSGLRVRDLRYFGVWGLPLVTKIPGIRELLTSAASCTLQPA